MSKLNNTILSLASILTGSLLFYFLGYKDNSFEKLIFFIIVFIGWLILYKTYFGRFDEQETTLHTKKIKQHKINRTFLRLLLRIVFFIAVVGNIILVENLTEERVAKILNYESTQYTVATTTKFDDRYSKTGSQHYIMIVYQVDNKIIHQAIYDYARQYSVGQKIKIAYSKEYPEMFKVIETLK